MVGPKGGPILERNLGVTGARDSGDAASLVQRAPVLTQLGRQRRRKSIGSNCAWSSSTAAPWLGKGVSSESSHTTSSPSDLAASYSVRTVESSPSVAA